MMMIELRSIGRFPQIELCNCPPLPSLCRPWAEPLDGRLRTTGGLGGAQAGALRA